MSGQNSFSPYVRKQLVVLATEQKDNNSAIAMLYPNILITSIKKRSKEISMFTRSGKLPNECVDAEKVAGRAPDEGRMMSSEITSGASVVVERPGTPVLAAHRFARASLDSVAPGLSQAMTLELEFQSILPLL
ncbi:hypothetical protein KC359_g169 [Hortaea werneckii]|nr:hypothetical protein KC359_g169 [Hortaea werneckii]